MSVGKEMWLPLDRMLVGLPGLKAWLSSPQSATALSELLLPPFTNYVM
jgi:hypothetical protein